MHVKPFMDEIRNNLTPLDWYILIHTYVICAVFQKSRRLANIWCIISCCSVFIKIICCNGLTILDVFYRTNNLYTCAYGQLLYGIITYNVTDIL